MSFDKNKHLDDVLESHKLKHIQDRMDRFDEKRDKVKDAVETKFSGKIVTRAINSGSKAKHTAINLKFDVDICQPFKYKSFDTLEKMADALFDYFQNEFEDEHFIKYKTRKQRVSVGITFVIDGEELQMDITPGRELSEDDYKETNRLNLFVRPKGADPATSTQTNIQKHVDHIKGKGDERKVARLLKIWKCNKGRRELKSFFIELITIRAFDYQSTIPSTIWEMLEMTMKYIRDNIESIRLEDPANSNNIVSNTLTDIEKKNLASDMKNMLQRIEDDAENLKIYFAVNDKYHKVDDEKNKKGNTGASVLSTKSFS
jgi:hypothetical protein